MYCLIIVMLFAQLKNVFLGQKTSCQVHDRVPKEVLVRCIVYKSGLPAIPWIQVRPAPFGLWRILNKFLTLFFWNFAAQICPRQLKIKWIYRSNLPPSVVIGCVLNNFVMIWFCHAILLHVLSTILHKIAVFGFYE